MAVAPGRYPVPFTFLATKYPPFWWVLFIKRPPILPPK